MDEINIWREIIAPAVGQHITPEQAMRLALHMGTKGAGYVAPNPLVGCVIVDADHRFLASGYHARLGGDHAEAAALRKIADLSFLHGAFVYVTLEPCAHQGRTPSCARALAQHKLASVIYAVEDPDPRVAGKGAAILREAGIATQLWTEQKGIPAEMRRHLTDSAEELAEIFLHNQRAGEPFVAIKIATSLDGQMAFRSGESKWITGGAARHHAHAVRARYDAVAVGVNTFINDNPALDVRHPHFPGLQNRAVVFDPRARALTALEANMRIIKVREAERAIFVVGSGVRVDNPFGVAILEVSLRDGQLDLPEALAGLRSLGVTSIMVEGGAATIASFIEARKAQRLHAYQAPVIFGGRDAIGWSSGFGGSSMAERIRLERPRRVGIGRDLYQTARLRFP